MVRGETAKRMAMLIEKRDDLHREYSHLDHKIRQIQYGCPHINREFLSRGRYYNDYRCKVCLKEWTDPEGGETIWNSI